MSETLKFFRAMAQQLEDSSDEIQQEAQVSPSKRDVKKLKLQIEVIGEHINSIQEGIKAEQKYLENMRKYQHDLLLDLLKLQSKSNQ